MLSDKIDFQNYISENGDIIEKEPIRKREEKKWESRSNTKNARTRSIWIFSFWTIARLAEHICNFHGSTRRGANSNKLSVAAA